MFTLENTYENLNMNFQNDFLKLPPSDQENLVGLLKNNLGDTFDINRLIPPQLEQKLVNR